MTTEHGTVETLACLLRPADIGHAITIGDDIDDDNAIRGTLERIGATMGDNIHLHICSPDAAYDRWFHIDTIVHIDRAEASEGQ